MGGFEEDWEGGGRRVERWGGCEGGMSRECRGGKGGVGGRGRDRGRDGGRDGGRRSDER